MDPIIWRVAVFEQIDSTNTWVAEQARQGADEGVVAVAHFQSAGRGRLQRRWEAPPGSSLLSSVLLRPSLDADHLQLCVAAVALSLRAALVRLAGVRPDLKWPNDLLVGDAKLAGLLAEVVTTEHATGMLVGFGVNLTSAPAGATSVREVTGMTLDPRGLLDIVLEELEPRRVQLDTDDGRARLREEYERALATLGRDVRVELRDDACEGRALRVDPAGRLVVEVDGVETVFFAGDVVHLRARPGSSA